MSLNEKDANTRLVECYALIGTLRRELREAAAAITDLRRERDEAVKWQRSFSKLHRIERAHTNVLDAKIGEYEARLKWPDQHLVAMEQSAALKQENAALAGQVVALREALRPQNWPSGSVCPGCFINVAVAQHHPECKVVSLLADTAAAAAERERALRIEGAEAVARMPLLQHWDIDPAAVVDARWPRGGTDV